MAVGSFSAGLSGLNANAVSLSVIGNNLANINTIGFKASTVSFMDLVSQTIGSTSANPMQVGLGVMTGSISPVFNQGAIENTREATNVAIQGGGFFIVRGDEGRSYTRAGNFSFDSSGALVTPDGYHVQGYTEFDPASGLTAANASLGDITIPPGVLRPPTATTQFRMLTNFNAAANVGDSFSTSIQVYDAMGKSHVLTMTSTKTAEGAWNYALTAPGKEVTGGSATLPYVLKTGTLAFDANGLLTAVDSGAPANVTITTPAWTNGAAASTMKWQVLDGTRSALSGYASPSGASSISQNGNGAGMIDNLSINSDGMIVATFGGGKTVPVAQLALASFNNPKGLVKLGSSRYGESEAAGLPNIGVAGTGGRGTVIGSALEQSNVDIAQEFTQMILAQRGYQANSKTITVSDEVLVETLNLKR